MIGLERTVSSLKQRIDEITKEAEEVWDLISRLDVELKLGYLNLVLERVERRLAERREWRENIADLRVVVRYDGKVDLVPSSRAPPMALTFSEFKKVVEKAKRLIREGNNLAPFFLLKDVADDQWKFVGRKYKDPQPPQ
jgi:hypothetical protein